MASLTTDYTLADSAWTQVSTSKASVVITNAGPVTLYYAVAAAANDLSSTIGHELRYHETIRLSDLGSNNVFIRSGNTGGGAKAEVSAY